MALAGSSVLNILQHTDENPAAGDEGPQSKDSDDSGSRKASGSSSESCGGRGESGCKDREAGVRWMMWMHVLSVLFIHTFFLSVVVIFRLYE